MSKPRRSQAAHLIFTISVSLFQIIISASNASPHSYDLIDNLNRDPGIQINTTVPSVNHESLPQIHHRRNLMMEGFLRSLSAEQSVKSIASSDGDIIDCVPLQNQPAFHHPLLKDHKLQRFPSSFPTGGRRAKRRARRRIRRAIAVPQVWHGNQGTRCPGGTVPIRRTSDADLERWAAAKKTSVSSSTSSYASSYGTKTHKPLVVHTSSPSPRGGGGGGDGVRDRHTPASPETSEKPVEVRLDNDSSDDDDDDHHHGDDDDNDNDSPPTPTKHEHAIAYVEGGEIYGASAVLSVWEPWIEASNEFSLSQVWILGGSFDGDLNSIEAGWQVSPELYGDGQPRLFIYWTTDGYDTTGCYNLLCSGFIQTSDTVAIGASIAPISSYGGSQYQIEIMIWKDPGQGNWWMAFEGTHIVGYWPSALFSHLSDSATMVEWGGEVVNSSPDGHHTGTQMGSGRFANDGFGYAGFFHSLQVVDSSNNLEAITNVQTLAENPKCYNIKSMQDPNWGQSFYFGGPGRNALCP